MRIPETLRFSNLALWRWLLPLGMLLSAMALELVVHSRIAELRYSPPGLALEVGLYAIIGPALLALFMHRTYRHQMAHRAAEESLRQAHAELERRVEERTAEIHARNRELEVLNAVAAELNRSADVRQALDGALDQVLDLLDLSTGWVWAYLIDESGQPELAAACNLPPALETGDLAAMADSCRCLHMLQQGRLTQPVSIVECERLHNTPGDTYGLGHHASIPIRAAGQSVGTLNLAVPSDSGFSDETVRLLGAISDQIGVAIERARLYELQRQQTTELARTNALIAALSRVAARLQTSLSPDQVMETLGEELRQLGVTCIIMMLDPDEEALIVRYGSVESRALTAAEKLTGYKMRGFRVPPERFPLFTDLIERQRTVFAPDSISSAVGLLPGLPGPVVERALRLAGMSPDAPAIYLPLMVEERVLGAIGLWGKNLQEADIPALSVFAGQVAAALEVARLYEQIEAQRIEEQAILLELSQTLLRETSMQGVMDQTVRVAADALEAELAAMALIDADGSGYSGRAGVGWPPDLLQQAQHIPLDADTGLGYAIRTRAPVVVFDESQETRFGTPPWATQMGITSSVLVPMLVGEEPIGGLVVNSRTPRSWSENQVRLLSLIASATAQALERARLHEETRRRSGELIALHDLALVVNRSLDLSRVLEVTVEHAAQLVNAVGASIFLVSEGGTLHPGAVRAPEYHVSSAQRLHTASRLWERFFAAGESFQVVPLAELPVDDPVTGELRRVGVETICLARLAHGGKPVALLGVLCPRVATPAEQQLIQTVAQVVSPAIAHAQSFHLTNEQLQATNQRLALANLISRRLSAILDVDELLTEVVRLVQVGLGYYHVSVALVEEDEIVFLANATGGDPLPTGLRLKTSERSVTGWVATHGQALLAPDVSQEPRFYPTPDLPNVRSELAVPIQAADRTLGVLNVESDEPAAFDETDQELLQAISDQLALALENARSFQEAQVQRDEATAVAEILMEHSGRTVAMHRVATALLGAANPTEAATIVLDGLRDEMGVEKSMLWLAEAGELKLTAALGVPPDSLTIGSTGNDADHPALTRVWRTGQAETRERFATPTACDTLFDDWLMLPVKARNEVLGVLVTERASLDEDILRIFLNQAALGLAAARSYDRLRDQAEILAHTNVELRRATQAKTDFMNRMSHELRTPLNAVIGFARLLQNQRAGPLNDKQARYAENISSSGEHLLELVNEVLDLAKIEAGKMNLFPERLPLADVMAGVVGMLTPRATEKNIRLEAGVSDPTLTVVADPTRLRQILLNLLTNAIKFTPEGGKVSVQSLAVSPVEASVISDQLTVISHQPSGVSHQSPALSPVEGSLITDHWLLITVQDTGVGIKEEDFPKIFGEFEQIDSPLSRAEEGTGLGLALTKHLVELHGGRIWFESVFGEGTTFRVALPMESATSDQSPVNGGER